MKLAFLITWHVWQHDHSLILMCLGCNATFFLLFSYLEAIFTKPFMQFCESASQLQWLVHAPGLVLQFLCFLMCIIYTAVATFRKRQWFDHHAFQNELQVSVGSAIGNTLGKSHPSILASTSDRESIFKPLHRKCYLQGKRCT